MKPLNFLILATILTISCSSHKVSDEIIITYNASTRGKTIQVKISSKIIEKNENENKIRRETPTSYWNEIKRLINKLNLEDINSFKPSSDKRLYDGALHATLNINLKSKVYESQTFDHGNPPKELKEIVEKVLNLNIE